MPLQEPTQQSCKTRGATNPLDNTTESVEELNSSDEVSHKSRPWDYLRLHIRLQSCGIT